MRQVGMAFIESWRDPFERKPFMLPAELEGWKLKDGVTKEFESKLQRWRKRLFALLALGLMLLIGGSLTILTGIVLSVLNGGRDQFELALLVGIPLFVLASLFMQIMVSRTAQNRPTMEEEITLVREAT